MPTTLRRRSKFLAAAVPLTLAFTALPSPAQVGDDGGSGGGCRAGCLAAGAAAAAVLGPEYGQAYTDGCLHGCGMQALQ